jgi:hypothetical protein
MLAALEEVTLTGEYRSRGDVAREVLPPLRRDGAVRVRVVRGSHYERCLQTLFAQKAQEVEPGLWEVRA